MVPASPLLICIRVPPAIVSSFGQFIVFFVRIVHIIMLEESLWGGLFGDPIIGTDGSTVLVPVGRLVRVYALSSGAFIGFECQGVHEDRITVVVEDGEGGLITAGLDGQVVRWFEGSHVSYSLPGPVNAMRVSSQWIVVSVTDPKSENSQSLFSMPLVPFSSISTISTSRSPRLFRSFPVDGESKLLTGVLLFDLFDSFLCASLQGSTSVYWYLLEPASSHEGEESLSPPELQFPEISRQTEFGIRSRTSTLRLCRIGDSKYLAVGDRRGELTLWRWYAHVPGSVPESTAAVHWHSRGFHSISFFGGSGAGANALLTGGEEGVIMIVHLGQIPGSVGSRSYIPRLGAAVRFVMADASRRVWIARLANNTICIISPSSHSILAKIVGIPCLGGESQVFEVCGRDNSIIFAQNSVLKFFRIHSNSGNLVERFSGSLECDLDRAGQNVGKPSGSKILRICTCGKVLVTVHANFVFRFWFFSKGQYHLVTVVRSPHGKDAEPHVVVVNDEMVCSGGIDGIVRVWTTFTEVVQEKGEFGSDKMDESVTRTSWKCKAALSFRSIGVSALAATGDVLAVAFGDTVTLWSLQTFERLSILCSPPTFRHVFSLICVGSVVIAAGGNAVLYWDISGDEPTTTILACPSALVRVSDDMFCVSTNSQLVLLRNLSEIGHVDISASPRSLSSFRGDHVRLLGDSGGIDGVLRLFSERTDANESVEGRPEKLTTSVLEDLRVTSEGDSEPIRGRRSGLRPMSLQIPAHVAPSASELLRIGLTSYCGGDKRRDEPEMEDPGTVGVSMEIDEKQGEMEGVLSTGVHVRLPTTMWV